MLELKNLTKTYGHQNVVKDVNLVIGKGEFFCLLGPSGCGKTTILRMIAGFEKVSAGNILLDGVDITERPPFKRDVNTVFQNYALFPNFDVYNNIAYSLMIKKGRRKKLPTGLKKSSDLQAYRDLKKGCRISSPEDSSKEWLLPVHL